MDRRAASYAAAAVYVNGGLPGDTDVALRAPCGMRFVRLALPSGSPASTLAWIAAGKGANIACRSLTMVKQAL